MRRNAIVFTLALASAACGSEPDVPADEQAGDDQTIDASQSDAGSDDAGPALTTLEAEVQRQGDPEAGYDYLLGGAYTGCGLPERVYSVANQLGVLPDGEPAPVRESDLPYFLSKFETENGETVVGPNCLTCHAGYVEDQLVIGAPGLGFDYGGLAQTAARFKQYRQTVSDQLQLTEAELAELDKFIERLETIAPYVQPEVVGVANPADNLAAILFAHRDPRRSNGRTNRCFSLPIRSSSRSIRRPGGACRRSTRCSTTARDAAITPRS